MTDTFTAYEYDICGYFTGNTITVTPMGGYPGPPARWTDVTMPEVPPGMYARFDLVQWHITSDPPNPPIPESEPAPVVAETVVAQSGEAPTVI